MSEAAIEPIGKREKTKVANRQAILIAARRVFAQLGYEAATVRDIILGARSLTAVEAFDGITELARLTRTAEAAWAKVVKQGEKADADERYAAALCTTASGSLAAFDAVFEIAQKSWAKKGGELRIALEAVRGPEPTKTLLGRLGGERKAKIAALEMLAGCGDKSAVGPLKPLLDDTDNEIRVVTINALRGIVDGDSPLDQLSAFESIEMAKKWKERN